MTLSELYENLKEKGIDDRSIYLHGLHGSADDNEKLALTIKKGKYTAIWEVYFKERGEKHSVNEFNDESSACEYYLKKMIENKITKAQHRL